MPQAQILSSTSRQFLCCVAAVTLSFVIVGCRRESKPQVGVTATASPAIVAAGSSAEKSTPTPPTESGTLVHLADLDDAEAKMIKKPWKGDFNELGSRRFIRALVLNNRTTYYIDRADQRGIAYESLREFEKSLSSNSATRHITTKIAIIPTTPERLLPDLAAGYGDIAIGNLTTTPEREKLVDFSDSVMDNVKELVLTGPSAPAISSIDDLSGREVQVRATSSYHETLKALNDRFRSAGKAPVNIRPADELLEDEDLIQMVDAGVIPITVIDDHIARFWSQIYDRVKVHDNLALREGGRISWALRKNTPEFRRVVNDFTRTHRAGTLFGNVMLKRYLGDADRLKNPTAEAEMERFRNMAAFFRKYGKQYDLPWLLIAAQGYQESGLDQSKRSGAGAVGVMQIKPDTAADPNVGIRDINTPENNIHAGVKYLRFIVNQYYKNEPIDRLNRGLFALASYNAGPARVAGLRKKAKAVGLDPNVWFNNVEVIAAREIGRETVDYVSNIYKYFVTYRSVAELREQRVKPRLGQAPDRKS
ncbi:MAG: lytic transglycosylase F [Acidobacteria bacterium]|nr:lytic transglycosylase F [Acidobacteriota bacterium]